MLEKEIISLAEQVAKDLDYLVVEAKFVGGSTPSVQIFLEKADLTPVSVEDCAKFSRSFSVLLDVNDLINNSYTLEISSPGINRKLSSIEDFKRFSGDRVSIKTKDLIEGRRNIKGTLKDVVGEEISVLLEGDHKIKIPFNMIKKANLDLMSNFNKSNKNK